MLCSSFGIKLVCVEFWSWSTLFWKRCWLSGPKDPGFCQCIQSQSETASVTAYIVRDVEYHVPTLWRLPMRSIRQPPKDKFWIWQNYVCLQIKLICNLYKKMLILGSFVVLTKIFFSFFWLMYWQNCIQNHFLFLYDRLNWLFYAIIFVRIFFASKKTSFVMCNKILYQTVLCLSRKKKLYEIMQFTCFYYVMCLYYKRLNCRRCRRCRRRRRCHRRRRVP